MRYVWLAAFAALFSISSAFLPGWWGGFLSNLGAGFVGSLLTVALIDRAIDAARTKERLRFKRLAFDRLRPAILRHLSFLFSLHKATATKSPDRKAAEIRGII